MSRISLTCLVARPRLTARSASTIGRGSTSPRSARDEVALLVAAGLRERLHAGVVALATITVVPSGSRFGCVGRACR